MCTHIYIQMYVNIIIYINMYIIYIIVQYSLNIHQNTYIYIFQKSHDAIMHKYMIETCLHLISINQ